MSASFATFDRLKSKGVAAYQRGEYSAAKSYLIEAAECLLELAEKAESPEVSAQHEELAQELIELAKDCDQRKHSDGSRARVQEREGANGQDASDWIVSEKPDIGFKDIAGLEDVKEEVRLKMIYPMSHPELARRYGIGIGGGVLLYGPPGTGKTMIAKAMAHELDATFFVISPAQILSKWVGEAEQNVRKLFEMAKERGRSVIFMDEVEALVPMRTSDSSSVMQRVVPQILQEMEGFDRKGDRALLFVAATNKPWMLDDAFVRPGRLDTKIYVGLPDAPARFRLLEIHFGNRPLANDVDFGELCDRLAGYSGADIRNIVQRSAAIPFTNAIGGQEARPICMADVLTVMKSTSPSVDEASLARFAAFARAGATPGVSVAGTDG